MVLLALVGSCLEPVATVVKERAVISLQVTRVPVSVRGSNISDATLAIAVKAQTVKASWRYPGLGDGLPLVQQGKPQWFAKASSHTACPVSWGRGPAYKLTKYTRNACTIGVNVRPNRPPIDYKCHSLIVEKCPPVAWLALIYAFTSAFKPYT